VDARSVDCILSVTICTYLYTAWVCVGIHETENGDVRTACEQSSTCHGSNSVVVRWLGHTFVTFLVSPSSLRHALGKKPSEVQRRYMIVNILTLLRQHIGISYAVAIGYCGLRCAISLTFTLSPHLGALNYIPMNTIQGHDNPLLSCVFSLLSDLFLR
jgi:hypothetical protein